VATALQGLLLTLHVLQTTPAQIPPAGSCALLGGIALEVHSTEFCARKGTHAHLAPLVQSLVPQTTLVTWGAYPRVSMARGKLNQGALTALLDTMGWGTRASSVGWATQAAQPHLIAPSAHLGLGQLGVTHPVVYPAPLDPSQTPPAVGAPRVSWAPPHLDLVKLQAVAGAKRTPTRPPTNQLQDT
jgi:hypothetical protein